MNMQTKLILAFFSIVLILTGVGYYNTIAGHKALQDCITEQSILRAKQMLDHIDETFYIRIQQLQIFANDHALEPFLHQSNQEFEQLEDIPGYIAQQDQIWQAAENSQITDFMADLINNPLSDTIRSKLELKNYYLVNHGHEVFSEVFITNKYGANVAQTQKTSDYYQADEKWWQVAKDNGMYISEVDFDKSANVLSVDVCIRISDAEGNLLGVMKAVINFEEIIHPLKNLDYKYSENFKLLTRDFKIIYASENYKFFQPLSENLVNLIANREDGDHKNDYTIIPGDEPGEGDEIVIWAYSSGTGTYKGLGWILLEELDNNKVMEPVFSLRARTLSILLVVTLLTIVLSVLISRSISTPIRKMKVVVKSISTGNLSARVENKSYDEIGQLIRSFNQMADYLQTSVADLEKSRCNAETLLEEAHTAKSNTENLIKRLSNTAAELKKLMIAAIDGSNINGRFENNTLVHCWEAKLCSQKDCPSYRNLDNLRCWETAGTFCGGKVHGKFANKLKDCRKCDVFQSAHVDSIKDLGETFNQMMVILGDRQQDLHEALIKAEAATHAKSSFLANMSHEIRTPMTAILGFADVLLEQGNLENAPPERIEAAHIIKRNSEHLLSIINDILDLSKVEAGKMVVDNITCNPPEIIADVTSMMKPRVDSSGLSFDVEYVGDIPESIQTDPTRLRQILINLIGNAVKFTETGGIRLIIRCISDAAESYMQFDILDTGIGLTQEQAAMLFQPFTQADNSTTRRFGGTGLGLIVSKRFAELLGGDITIIDSHEGVGTRFRITIATGSLENVKMLADPRTSTVVSSDSNPVIVNHKDIQSRRILLAEDGTDNQRLISFVLQKAGAEVTITENGKLAYESALAAQKQGNAFDCILMDMQMPVMSGYEATRKLRMAGYSSTIIALTANAMDSDREKCIKAGCDDFATKPIDRAKLINVIAQQIQKQVTAA